MSRVLLANLALLAAPFLFLPYAFDTREAPRAALVLVFAALVVATGRVRLRLWSMPWLGTAVLGAFWAVAPAHETLLGVVAAAQGTLLWVGYTLIILSWAAPADRQSRYTLAMALTLAQVVIALLQLIQGRPVDGTLGHPVFLGAWGALGATVAIGALIDGRQRALAAVALLAGLGCIVLAGRRGPMLMLLVAFAGAVILVRPSLRRLWPLAAAVGLAALALAPRLLLLAGDAGETTVGRLTTFTKTWAAIGEHLFRGFGPSRYADLAATWTPAGFSYYEARPHNLLLLVAFSLGVPAVVAFLLFVGGATRQAFANVAAAAPGERGSLAAAAMLGPAYGCHLLVNIDQPGVGLWVCALWATAVNIGPARTLLPLRHLVAVGLVVAGLLPVVGSIAVEVCQRQNDDDACRIAEATGSTGCLALRARAEGARRLRGPSSAADRLDWMQTCLERNPDDWLARYQRGRALADSGRDDEAISELERVTVALPGIDEAQMALVELFVRRGQARHALTVLFPERARAEMRGPMWRLRGMLYDELGESSQAIADYREALRYVPGDPWLSQRISELESLLVP